VRSYKFIGLCWLALWTFSLHAETFQLNDGRTLTGDLLVASANDAGVQIKSGEGKYEKVSWSDFSQAALKEIAQKPKLGQFVEPFIEIPQGERVKKTEVKINDVPRLSLPAKGSLLGSLFGSSVGLVCLLLIYGANIYAGYVIGAVRAYSPGLVCGIAAVAPFVGPIIFLCLPTRMDKVAEPIHAEPPAAELITSSFAGDPDAVQHATGLHFADQPQAAGATLPETQIFQRGQFTFNRRFIETKFSGFFGLIRRDVDKDLLLVLKTARGEFIAHRITRIAANDMHVEVRKGTATSEVSIPFGEIQEIQLKHKEA
jgi:hypothetical protein